jgi:hypothetical protein
MSAQKNFGVECKNPKCHSGLILGDYMSRPQSKGEAMTFISIKAGKLLCPSCGKTYEYDRNDLREFS